MSLRNRMRNSVCMAWGGRWLARSAKRPVLIAPLGSHLRIVWWVIRSFTSDFAMVDTGTIYSVSTWQITPVAPAKVYEEVLKPSIPCAFQRKFQMNLSCPLLLNQREAAPTRTAAAIEPAGRLYFQAKTSTFCCSSSL